MTPPREFLRGRGSVLDPFMDVKTFWSTADWASAIASLPSPGPLPTRTVLVSREPVAHVLRRELIRSGQGNALAGTRFLPLAAAAAEVLREAGTLFAAGEESLRPARILTLFRGSSLTLAQFPLELLRSTPGWDDAFARTISDLEAAALRPADLEAPGASDPRPSAFATSRRSGALSTSPPAPPGRSSASSRKRPPLWRSIRPSGPSPAPCSAARAAT